MVQETKEWFASPRFKGVRRLYSARQVVQQQGTLEADYPVARKYSEEFFNRLRELFKKGEQITSFGPYSPGQAVAMKRIGIEGIYLGGWGHISKRGRSMKTRVPTLQAIRLVRYLMKLRLLCARF